MTSHWELCRNDDLLLESYVVRHLGGHAIERDRSEGEMLLRRSLHLRAALGARPQTAAAQVTLASQLPEGPEREMLREAARATTKELGLTWLKDALSDVDGARDHDLMQQPRARHDHERPSVRLHALCRESRALNDSTAIMSPIN